MKFVFILLYSFVNHVTKKSNLSFSVFESFIFVHFIIDQKGMLMWHYS